MRRYIKYLWERISDAGNLQFIWGLVPAAATSGMSAWFSDWHWWQAVAIGLPTWFFAGTCFLTWKGVRLEEKRHHEAAQPLSRDVAKLSLEASGNDLREIGSTNIASWHGRTMQITFHDQSGEKSEDSGFKRWFVALWFDGAIYDYQAKGRAVSGQPMTFDISWQAPNGLYFTVEAPKMPTVFEITVERRSRDR